MLNRLISFLRSSSNCLPIEVNKRIDGRVIKEVGVSFSYNKDSSYVPVRYRGGEYGILYCEGGHATSFMVENAEAKRLIAQSSKMPVFRHGMGSFVWHIIVGEGDNDVLIKSYYGDKWDRGEEIYRNLYPRT